jgi:excisionase family DNA binding protein
VERQAVSIIKAAQLVGVSRRTIYNWLASGKLEYVRTAGGSVRIFVDSLWRDPLEVHQRTIPETIVGVISGNLS